MTGQYYMGNDFRNDHSFRIPRPDQTIKYGTPNACTPCHTDQTDQWAVDFIREKYGPLRPDHFSDRLLAGLEGNTDSLISLLRQTRFPEIARATAVQQFARQTDEPEELDFLIGLLKDSSALVRREVVNMLDELGVPVEEEIKPLLSDTVRAVRIAAARYFEMRNTRPDWPGFAQASKEYMTELEVNSDFASGNHQWALYYSANGERESAMAAYREALRIDNLYNPSRMNLALMEYENGNVKRAEELYLKVIEQEPNYSYPWFMLGLLYNETDKAGKSLANLMGACEREPFLVRAHYNYALKLQELKKYAEAEVILDKALAEVPGNTSILYVKLIGAMEMGKDRLAKQLAERLVALEPQNQQYKSILTELNNKDK
jgi:tetratricopeptide (TPR) repeat protein